MPASGSEARPLPDGVVALASASTPHDEPKHDPKVEATASLVPGRTDAPAATPRPIDPDRPIAPPNPRDIWGEGLDRLRSIARDRAEGPGDVTQGLWSLRCQLLDWLSEPENPSDADDGDLRRTVLTALAATTGPETAVPSTRSAQVRAAVEALEERAPLEIIVLQLCRKVKGFGEFEPLDAEACRPGRGVIVYCEMAGLRYEPEGSHYRSRLSSRIEVVAPGGSEPVWTHDLGTADDLCRRRRRDYYVNYRITLPESLSPGTYELRLIQDDLVANRAVTRAVPLVIPP